MTMKRRLRALEGLRAHWEPMPVLAVFPEGEDLNAPGARVFRVQIEPQAAPPPPPRRAEP